MKRLLCIVLCFMVLCTAPIVAFAEDDSVGEVETTEKPESLVEAELTTDKVISYVKEHLEEISVIITLIVAVFYEMRKRLASLSKSMGTLNNNAVNIAQNSENAIGEAKTFITNAANIIAEYKDEIANLLTEVRANEEEKQKLAQMVASAEKYLSTAKTANIELANELAELLILANIPNSKKEELYARHRAVVDAIATLENAEVKTGDHEET